LKIGIDIGGTFTDLTLLEAEAARLHHHKVPSTPDAPSRAVALGIVELMRRLGRSPAELTGFVHGTTIALNAVLERRGARVALLVTEGARDVLEIARLQKAAPFNLRAAEPAGLVPRARVLELRERIDALGKVILPLDAEHLRGALATVPKEVETIAICLLNAHANDAHEREAARLAAQAFPGRHISLSSALWPEIREYERAMVAVLNAYVQPVLGRYVEGLQHDMADIGMKTKLYITQSNGGIMSTVTARDAPVRTLLSGPASGVVGAAYVARLAGVRNAVTIDIGGTSADVSLIRDGEPAHSTEARVSEFPVVMPSVDVFAVGAGGGSIAWFDSLGLLKVGPRSAGASPGPACYGRGGTEPTVTDAYVVCGFLNPENFLGGSMRLDPALARRAVGTIAQRLSRSAEAAAEAILKIATTNMITALLPMMTKRGVDPRGLALIPFGGAGSTHACLLAEEVVIPRIVVPLAPGTTCALGASIADIRADYIRSLRRPMTAVPDTELQAAFAELEHTGRDWLKVEEPAIVSVEAVRSVDARYAGQAFDIEVLLCSSDGLDAATIAQRFHDTYDTLYRNADRSAQIDLINLRVRIVGKTRPPETCELAGSEGPPVERTRRDIWYGGAWHAAPVFARESLLAGHVVPGPAIIEQFDTTTVVAPGFKATTDNWGILVLTHGK